MLRPARRRNAATLITTAYYTGALSLIVGPHVGAQGLNAPSAHFGSITFPRLDEKVQWGLHFDRFTNLGKDTLANGQWDSTQYNGIDHAIGLNEVSYSAGKRLGKGQTLLRLQAHVAVIGEEPTKFLQNHVVHDLKGLARVPAPNAASGVAGGIGLELNHFYAANLFKGSALEIQSPLFIGTGLAVSTIHSDAYVQTGIRSPSWALTSGGHRTFLPSVSGMARLGAQRGGLEFRDAYLENLFVATQIAVTVPLSHWWEGAGFIPDIEYTKSSDSFFRSSPGVVGASNGKAMQEQFCGVVVKWSNLTFSHWNDSCGGKDKGPTYGIHVLWEMGGDELNVFRWLPR